MKKRLVRLTESDIHNIILETVNKIVSEGNYDMKNGGFDKYAYDYDRAIEDSENIEDFDEKMRRRDKFAKSSGKNAQHWHPQAEPLAQFKKNEPHGSTDSFRYVHEPNLDIEKETEATKKHHGF